MINVNCRIIVANSFCSIETLEQIKNVAEENDCDFLNLENKGYGHSLNEGIDYARKHYDYKYLIITNADILVKKVDMSHAPNGMFALAPEIITKNGKRQNPFYVFPHFKLFHFTKWLVDFFKLRQCLLIVIVAKIERILFNLLFGTKKGKWKKIYAGHGSHILFSKETIDKVMRPFVDDIFLYCEENFLGYKLRKLEIPFYYSCDVSVIHMEDGSQSFYKHKINEETKKSGIKYHKLIENE